MHFKDYSNLIIKIVKTIAAKCPQIAEDCYWAGTSAISIEELHHRQSLDVDLHTITSLSDVRPFLAELTNAFKNNLTAIGGHSRNGFRAVLTADDKNSVSIDVLSNYQDVPTYDLVQSSLAPELKRLSLNKYLRT